MLCRPISSALTPGTQHLTPSIYVPRRACLALDAGIVSREACVAQGPLSGLPAFRVLFLKWFENFPALALRVFIERLEMPQDRRAGLIR